MAAELPEVTEGERYGNRVGGKAFAWDRPFSQADIRRFGEETLPGGPILAVRVEDLSEKEAVLAANPDAFFTIPHFDGYPAVLIQLPKVDAQALRGRRAGSTSRSPRQPRPSPGLAPVKRNRFIALDGAVKSINCELEARARELAGLKSFRMSKPDLQARPIYHRKRDSIEAHLTIVFAALAVSRWIEARTGWSIRRFVKTARRYRTIEIRAGRQTITAADLIPNDLRQALDAINRPN